MGFSEELRAGLPAFYSIQADPWSHEALLVRTPFAYPTREAIYVNAWKGPEGDLMLGDGGCTAEMLAYMGINLNLSFKALNSLKLLGITKRRDDGGEVNLFRAFPALPYKTAIDKFAKACRQIMVTALEESEALQNAKAAAQKRLASLLA